MLVAEEFGLEVEDVVVEEVLKELVLLEAGLAVLGETEVLLDDDDGDDEVIVELVEEVDEVVGGTVVGDVEVVVLVGEVEEGDCEIAGTCEVVGTTGGTTDGIGREAMVIR